MSLPVGHAQNLLLGPLARRVRAKIELDPRLPTGPERRLQLATDPPSPERACSFRLPLCVEYEHRTEHWAADALSFLEHAYRRAVYGASLPAPLTTEHPLVFRLVPRDTERNASAHGSAADADVELATELVTDLGAAFERAGMVCRFGVTTAPERTRAHSANHRDSNESGDDETAIANRDALRRAAWHCVGEAIAARLDAAEGPTTRRAYAQALAWELATPSEYPADPDRALLVRANAQPSLGISSGNPTYDASALALLYSYLDFSLGSPQPLGLPTGLLAMSAQPRTAETARFQNEPDWLDVLRDSLGDSQLELARQLNAFALARSRMGHGDGALSPLHWLTALAPLVPDWELPLNTLPRKVASLYPIQPLGFIAVRVELDHHNTSIHYALRADWESPSPFTWTVVKLDAQTQVLGRMDLAFEPRATAAEKQLEEFGATTALLVLGTNLGGLDTTHLLDPDRAPFEPHGCTVYVTPYQNRGVDGFRCQVSGVRFQVSGVRCQVSGFRFQVSGFRCQNGAR
ncbi:MAG: hypothetical protein QM784_13740 [Polyangiaceae bacterium]